MLLVNGEFYNQNWPNMVCPLYQVHTFCGHCDFHDYAHAVMQKTLVNDSGHVFPYYWLTKKVYSHWTMTGSLAKLIAGMIWCVTPHTWVFQPINRVISSAFSVFTHLGRAGQDKTMVGLGWWTPAHCSILSNGMGLNGCIVWWRPGEVGAATSAYGWDSCQGRMHGCCHFLFQQLDQGPDIFIRSSGLPWSYSNIVGRHFYVCRKEVGSDKYTVWAELNVWVGNGD